MVRQQKHKLHIKSSLLLVLVPFYVLLTTLNVLAAVTNPGCYSDYSGTAYQGACSGVKDTYGNAVDSSKYCYIVSAGDNGKTLYQPVDCTMIISSSTGYPCGAPGQQVHTSIDLGCKGKGNPILDMTFGIIRFLSYGVGFIVVASIIVAGIQYTTSQGDPQAAAAAEKRIKSTVSALLIYIFAYAILNYVIPQGFLSQ
ncbi:MAG TPA: hypothetical protein VFN56_03115 [Candidatus Saccharimonadales bacterium]|nr:hypothetical protein [Candidatus Saccharimonadales bacterium]